MENTYIKIIEKDLISILPKEKETIIRYFRLLKELCVNTELLKHINSQEESCELIKDNEIISEKIDKLKKSRKGGDLK